MPGPREAQMAYVTPRVTISEVRLFRLYSQVHHGGIRSNEVENPELSRGVNEEHISWKSYSLLPLLPPRISHRAGDHPITISVV